MKLNLRRIAVLTVLAGTTAGCATVTRGSTEDVQFTSNPQGATVTTTIGPSCVTPCTLKFSRRDTFTATFKLGEQTQEVFVDTQVATEGVAVAGVGNALIGGVIGVGVDVATGAGLDHVPNPVIVTFTPEPEPSAPETPGTEEAANEEAATEETASEQTEDAQTTDPEPATTKDDGFKWES